MTETPWGKLAAIRFPELSRIPGSASGSFTETPGFFQTSPLDFFQGESAHTDNASSKKRVIEMNFFKDASGALICPKVRPCVLGPALGNYWGGVEAPSGGLFYGRSGSGGAVAEFPMRRDQGKSMRQIDKFGRDLVGVSNRQVSSRGFVH